MKTAIMADVDPATCHLEQVKIKVATAIGKKLPEEMMKPLFHVTWLNIIFLGATLSHMDVKLYVVRV